MGKTGTLRFTDRPDMKEENIILTNSFFLFVVVIFVMVQIRFLARGQRTE